jgi:hypothetical protein
MATLITEDDLDALDLRFAGDTADSDDGGAWDDDEAGLTPEQHHEIADVIERWATATDEFTVGGQLTAPILLLIAAEHRHAAGDVDNAHRLAGIARDHADAEPYEAHPTFIDFALEAGDDVQAAFLADEVRRAQPSDLAFYSMIGESYEEHGDDATAERWYTLGVEMMVRTGETDDPEYLGLLISRAMLREEMGLPADDFDRYVALLSDEGEL